MQGCLKIHNLVLKIHSLFLPKRLKVKHIRKPVESSRQQALQAVMMSFGNHSRFSVVPNFHLPPQDTLQQNNRVI
eukprot:1350773-Amorphochlora_amoeboformis.AAC.1